jgi:predicted ATPase
MEDIDITDDIYNLINMFTYKKIFILDPLPYYQDDVRVENRSYQLKIDREMRRVYRSLGYEIITIPEMAIQDRVKKILDYI